MDAYGPRQLDGKRWRYCLIRAGQAPLPLTSWSEETAESCKRAMRLLLIESSVAAESSTVLLDRRIFWFQAIRTWLADQLPTFRFLRRLVGGTVRGRMVGRTWVPLTDPTVKNCQRALRDADPADLLRGEL